MANVLARILTGGDDHLCSKNYGGHRDYAQESIWYFQLKTRVLEQYQCTHYIGLGDLSTGRFNTLEYRMAVETELRKQMELTQGRRWELKGNHDKATYGMTEYEYYVATGLIRPSENLRIGQVNISMVDHGMEFVKGADSGLAGNILTPSDECLNVVFAHNFFVNEGYAGLQYGKAIDLEKMHDWFGVDYLISGHIHEPYTLSGHINSLDGTRSNQVVLQYPGCMARPAFRKSGLPTQCQMVILTIYDDGNMEYNSIDIDLWPVEKSFNLEKREQDEEIEEVKHVDVSDIVTKMASYTNTLGSPEDVIRNMPGVDDRYKQEALRLLAES